MLIPAPTLLMEATDTTVGAARTPVHTTPRVSTASDTLTREPGTQARRAIRYVKCNGDTGSAVKEPKLQAQMCLLAGPRASPHMQVARLSGMSREHLGTR